MWIDLFYKRTAFLLWTLSTGMIVPCAAQTSAFSSGKHRLIPPSQAVAPAILTADSGPKLSGAGKNWSQWYRVGAGKAPSGYTLQHVDFWLSGDRSCGSGAECREIVKNDEQALWEFRLKGHKGAPPKTSSVGHIRVLYRPK